jgi:tRNA (guanine6-N2)-methyltransferase
MWHIELEVPEGLEDISLREIKQQLSKSIQPKLSRDGILTFQYDDDLKKLERLKSVYASYAVMTFPIPRPKALLGHQYFTEIVKTCQMVTQCNDFNTVTINAAGSGSSVMQRVLHEISEAIGLVPSQDDGDLLIRIRKLNNQWQVLVRTTPRPLSTRAWRAHDYQGALNAPVAYSMNQLVTQDHLSAYANFMCGSGALLIEHTDSYLSYGIDNDPYVLSLAQDHIVQAGTRHIQLLQADVTQSPFGDNSLSAITSDMPFGQLVGSHNENRQLYPAVLKEMHRTLIKDGLAVVITHEVRLIEKIIQSQNWRIVESRKTNLRGLHPRIYVLEKQ